VGEERYLSTTGVVKGEGGRRVSMDGERRFYRVFLLESRLGEPSRGGLRRVKMRLVKR